MEDACNAGKNEIIRAIEDRVEIFDLSLETSIRTDWSKEGMGYYMCQKACQCPGADLTCCLSGWRICLAGSRFNMDAETRYAFIEGEAQAVAWALEQRKLFTQGCDRLTVATDHKPLVSLLGQKSLDQVANARLFRIRQRISMWKVIHCPGKAHFFADPTSRRPVRSDDDDCEMLFIAANLAAIAISREEAAAEAQRDPEYLAMHSVLSEGVAPNEGVFPVSQQTLPHGWGPPIR